MSRTVHVRPDVHRLDGTFSLGLVLHAEPGPPFAVKKIRPEGKLGNVWPRLIPGLLLVEFEGVDVTRKSFADVTALIRSSTTANKPVTLVFASPTSADSSFEWDDEEHPLTELSEDDQEPSSGGGEKPTLALRDFDHVLESASAQLCRTPSWKELSNTERETAVTLGYDCDTWEEEDVGPVSKSNARANSASQLLPTP